MVVEKKKRKPRKKSSYFSIPISGREFLLFTSTLPAEKLKTLMMRMIGTRRPGDTDHFIFIVFEKGVLYFFVVSLRAKGRDNKVYIVKTGDGFVEEFVRGATGFIYPEEQAKIILDLGVREELEHARLRLSSTRQAKTPDQASFYAKEVEEYVNDLSRPIGKQHAHLTPIITKKREQLLGKYLRGLSLPLTGVSRKNRSLIQKKRKQIQMKKEESQRTDMERQDRAPLPRQVVQSVRIYGNDPHELEDDVLWKQLGLLDPVSLERIRNPVVLPSSSIVDQSSVPSVRLRGRDPFTNLPLAGATLQVNRTMRKLIGNLSQKAETITNDNLLSAREKARHLLQLRQEYDPLLKQAK